jgi:hypothetical protein
MDSRKNNHLTELEWNGIANAIQLLRHYEALGIITVDERYAVEKNLTLFREYLLTWLESDGTVKWSKIKEKEGTKNE